jgi:Flp pilus assembly protein TadG
VSDRRTDDRGTAVVEMALVLPLLLMVIFAIVDFGRMYNAQITLTEAARDGARAAVLGTNATTRTQSAAQGLSGVTVTVTGCPAAPAATDDATVVAHYSFEFVTPLAAFMGLIGGGHTASAYPMTGRGVMPCLG